MKDILIEGSTIVHVDVRCFEFDVIVIRIESLRISLTQGISLVVRDRLVPPLLGRLSLSFGRIEDDIDGYKRIVPGDRHDGDL
jgi:hypothetical protein